MGSVAGFGQKEKEIPSYRKGDEYCGVVKANLTRSPLRCRSDRISGRAKLQRDSITARTRFLREETLIGGWRATCFIGWLEWPAWLAAELLHLRDHETSKMRRLVGGRQSDVEQDPSSGGAKVNPEHEANCTSERSIAD
jgi:hypothetical protein